MSGMMNSFKENCLPTLLVYTADLAATTVTYSTVFVDSRLSKNIAFLIYTGTMGGAWEYFKVAQGTNSSGTSPQVNTAPALVTGTNATFAASQWHLIDLGTESLTASTSTYPYVGIAYKLSDDTGTNQVTIMAIQYNGHFHAPSPTNWSNSVHS